MLVNTLEMNKTKLADVVTALDARNISYELAAHDDAGEVWINYLEGLPTSVTFVNGVYTNHTCVVEL